MIGGVYKLDHGIEIVLYHPMTITVYSSVLFKSLIAINWIVFPSVSKSVQHGQHDRLIHDRNPILAKISLYLVL